MIFFDEAKNRGFILRISLIVIGILLLALVVDVIITITQSRPSATSRDLRIDPSYYSSPVNDKRIALTFDDGPNDTSTLRVVEILKEHNVPATFFFVGANILKYPDVAKSIADDGFEIGNHTYSHSLSVHDSPERIGYELAFTNYLIENTAGKQAILYRPPFLLDIEKEETIFYTNIQENNPLTWVREYGYIPIGVDTDTNDWDASSPEEVMENLKESLEPGDHIVLLHDGGGDIRHSVDSLEDLILYLKGEGYTFVPVSSLIGLTQADIMPPAVRESSFPFEVHTAFLSVLTALESTIPATMSVLLVFVLLRIIVVLGLRYSGRVRRHKRMLANNSWTGSVSVLIPAYNEEDNIASTIHSVMANSYTPTEVLVIDDGSKDGTSKVVEECMSQYPGTLKLIRKENGGKADALNVGFSHARGDVVIALDADTYLDTHALRYLIRHFSDSEVEAVAGKVLPVRSRTLISIFQIVEYLVGQNIEREAFATINAIGVVPGAIGAWRRQSVLAVGGYGTDTIVEDQDLTVAFLKKGKKIVYESLALAYTEPPQTTRDFIKQRFRWVYGTLQVFWKYKRSLGNTKRVSLGYVVLPNILIYNTILPVISLAIDIAFVWSLMTRYSPNLILAYCVFTFFDMLYAMLALWNEPGYRKYIWVVPLQRIYYRIIISYVIIRGLIKAVEGSEAFWNKVKRHGLAHQHFLKNTEQNVIGLQ